MRAAGEGGLAFGGTATFPAPTLFFTFVYLFGAGRAGLGGLLVVLAAGLVAMMPLRRSSSQSEVLVRR